MACDVLLVFLFCVPAFAVEEVLEGSDTFDELSLLQFLHGFCLGSCRERLVVIGIDTLLSDFIDQFESLADLSLAYIALSGEIHDALYRQPPCVDVGITAVTFQTALYAGVHITIVSIPELLTLTFFTARVGVVFHIVAVLEEFGRLDGELLIAWRVVPVRQGGDIEEVIGRCCRQAPTERGGDDRPVLDGAVQRKGFFGIGQRILVVFHLEEHTGADGIAGSAREPHYIGLLLWQQGNEFVRAVIEDMLVVFFYGLLVLLVHVGFCYIGDPQVVLGLLVVLLGVATQGEEVEPSTVDVCLSSNGRLVGFVTTGTIKLLQNHVHVLDILI